jgi:hypothetical protein
MSSHHEKEELHIRPHVALIGDCPAVSSKQRVAGSNPARRTRSEVYQTLGQLGRAAKQGTSGVGFAL